jgi:hypothetical protein
VLRTHPCPIPPNISAPNVFLCVPLCPLWLILHCSTLTLSANPQSPFTTRHPNVAKRGRKRILDGYKRREIFAILAVGCSRAVAARYVGCSVQTIQNTADRDPNFAQQLRRREHQSEIGYLENIRAAARNERYWRAAAWALERLRPERYARRSPDAITIDQIKALLTQFAEIIVEEVPVAKYRKNILKRLDAISGALKGASKNWTCQDET